MTILIDNFSIGVEEWATTFGLQFAVDVVDHTYAISVSGTYFVHNNQVVSTTYSGIIDGYRCFYEPTDISSSGIINLMIHAENTSSGVAEETYFLLYGYNCSFNEVVDWGAKVEVVTAIEATNEVFCPNVVTDAFYFETKDLSSLDLKSTIRAIESVDLGAVLYPQNKFFFYGRTYTIIINGVRDFSGNTMDDYTLTFTIENPNI